MYLIELRVRTCGCDMRAPHACVAYVVMQINLLGCTADERCVQNTGLSHCCGRTDSAEFVTKLS